MSAMSNVRDVRWIADQSVEFRRFTASKIAEKKARQIPVLTETAQAIVTGSQDSPVSESAVPGRGSQIHDVSCSVERSLPRPRPIGHDVEKAVRFCLAMQVKLEQDTVLAWRERQRDNAFFTSYQQVDAVWMADYDCAVLYEIKFATRDRMKRLFGRHQLERAARVAQYKYRQVCTRLVYIGDDLARPVTGLPNINPADLNARTGIVWIRPTEVERAAQSLGLQLPPLWWDLEGKYTSHTPEGFAPAWRGAGL